MHREEAERRGLIKALKKKQRRQVENKMRDASRDK